MKALVCEMCDGHDIMKDGDFYICQSCGTKYTVESAKKLMVEIEGTVDVSGSSVKIDQSEELQNLYEVARRAKDDNNTEKAAQYYDQIVIKDPTSWEAAFYSVYFQSLNCKIAEIESAANRITNCEESVLKLIKGYVEGQDAQQSAVKEMTEYCLQISQVLYSAAENHYRGIDLNIKPQFATEYAHRKNASNEIVLKLAEKIESIMGNEFMGNAVLCWKQYVNRQVQWIKKAPEKYVDLIRKYEPDYTPPQKQGGCYVATCVYGSYDCPQVWTLRRFRDDTLATTRRGRAFIHTYYAISPTLVKWFGETKWFRRLWKAPLDRMVTRLHRKGVEDTPYQDKQW